MTTSRRLLAAAVITAALAARPWISADAADPPPLAPTAVWEVGVSPDTLAISGDGGLLAIGSPSGGTLLHDAATGKLVKTLPADSSPFGTRIEFAGGARRSLVRFDRDAVPVIVNPATGAKRAAFEQPKHRGPIAPTGLNVELAVASGGKSVFAVWNSEAYVDLHDAETGKVVDSLSFAPARPIGAAAPEFVAVRFVAASGDGRFVAAVVARVDGDRLCVCDLGKSGRGPGERTWAELPKAEWDSVFSVGPLSDDGRTLLTTRKVASDALGQVTAWNTATGSAAWKLPAGAVTDVAMRRDTVVAVLQDRLQVLDAASGKLRRSLELLDGIAPFAVALSPAGDRVYAGYVGRRIAVYDLGPPAPQPPR